MTTSQYFKVGAAKQDITPPLNIPYLGFYPRHCTFTGVLDRLYCRAIVINNGESEFAIISSDSFGFSDSILGENRSFINEVRNEIFNKTGVKSECVMITGSHIHSTPDTLNFRQLSDVPGALEWMEDLILKIADSVIDAKSNMFEAKIKSISSKVDGVSYNRRGDSCVDNELIVMCFESICKDRMIVVVNFACHPVIMQVTSNICADFVGVIENEIVEKIENIQECLFLQGACADIDPSCSASGNIDDAMVMGRKIADEVLKCCDLMDNNDYPYHSQYMNLNIKTIMLNSRILPNDEEVKNMQRELETLYLQMNKEISFKLKESISRIENSLQRVKLGSAKSPAEIQIMRVGDLVFVGLPFEPFCRIGLTIKQLTLPLVGVPVGYANGYLGYIAPKDAWKKGGYEVRLGEWSIVDEEAYDLIIAYIEDGIKQIKS